MSLSIIFADNQLGVAPPQTDGRMIVLGYCTAGTTGTVYSFSNKTASQVRTELGRGKLAQLVASMVSTPNHGEVYAIPLASSAGTVTSVTSTGTSPPVVTITGTPYDRADLRVEILTAGARGTATFRYCIDYNSDKASGTWSAEIVTAATYAITELGITLGFATGTNYAVDNRYVATCYAPTHSNVQVTDGFDVISAAGLEAGGAIVLNQHGAFADNDATRATASLSQAAALSTKIAALVTAKNFQFALMEAPEPVANTVGGETTWRNALIAAASALSDPRVFIAAGQCRKLSDLDGATYFRSAIFPAAEKLTASPLHEDIGFVGAGSLRGITSIRHNEFASGGLNTARFLTLTTVPSQTGFYFAGGKTFAANGSDYDLPQNVRVINKAATVTVGVLSKHINDSFQTLNGNITEDEASALDEELTSALKDALLYPGHVSAVSARVSRTDNIVSTKTLTGEVTVVPRGYAKAITFTVGFGKNVPAAA